MGIVLIWEMVVICLEFKAIFPFGVASRSLRLPEMALVTAHAEPVVNHTFGYLFKIRLGQFGFQ